MAVVTPPLFQTVDSTYTAADLGLPYRDIVSEGVVGADDLEVSQRSAGANLSVDVAAGTCWIQGDESTSQPTYRCTNDGTVNLAIAAADGSDPRIDLVIAEVRDSAFAGVSTDWRLRVITGTPAGVPAAPSIPDNAIALAQVSVPASDTTIADGQITDARVRAQIGAGLNAVPTVTALPTAPYDGQVVDYVADGTDGVVWRLKYRAASASSYKWEFISGAPLYAQVAAAEAASSTAGVYQALSTPGPSITLPLAGDYDIGIATRGANSADGSGGRMSYDIGGTGAVDADAIEFFQAGATSVTVNHARPVNRKTGLAAGTILVAKYQRTVAGAATFTGRTIWATPVRVG